MEKQNLIAQQTHQGNQLNSCKIKEIWKGGPWASLAEVGKEGAEGLIVNQANGIQFIAKSEKGRKVDDRFSAECYFDLNPKSDLPWQYSTLVEKQNLIAQQTHQEREAKEKEDSLVEEHGYGEGTKGGWITFQLS